MNANISFQWIFNCLSISNDDTTNFYNFSGIIVPPEILATTPLDRTPRNETLRTVSKHNHRKY
ncbi:hypothetical protein M5K25_008233 [Dendrobium thyrsiflorum]|uniref:Uncharacterized protein n=1 Tax=Dendrobium thyrsiflorum TaxID=117978 RepID=A0ABD0V8N3_DENTH